MPLPTPIGTAPAGHVRLATLLIGGEHYPVSQFAIGKPDRCDDSHYHSPLTVYSIEAVRRGKPVRGIKDPAPEECGFGRVREVPVQDIDVTTAEFDAYRAALIGQ